MPEVYTISGSAAPFVVFGAPSAVEVACAQKVKSVFIGGAVAKVGGIGVGLFGTYKFFKKRPATGAVSILSAAVLWFVGTRMMVSAANLFDQCRKAP